MLQDAHRGAVAITMLATRTDQLTLRPANHETTAAVGELPFSQPNKILTENLLRRLIGGLTSWRVGNHKRDDTATCSNTGVKAGIRQNVVDPLLLRSYTQLTHTKLK